MNRSSVLSTALCSKLASTTTTTTSLPPIIPLTKSKSSWILHLPGFLKPPSRQVFQQFFAQHPPERHSLFIYGKPVLENRWSQLYVKDLTSVGDGASYKYSGTSRSCIICDESVEDQLFVMQLCRAADTLLQQLIQRGVVDTPSDYTPGTSHYNCALVNWYMPEHSIGLHADDESQMDNTSPIWSLSWGGPRRFLLRPKQSSSSTTTTTQDAIETCKDMLLKSGDLIAMGGQCQQEFKHEVPKLRKKDGLVDHRISWTIRRIIKAKNKGTKRKVVQN